MNAVLDDKDKEQEKLFEELAWQALVSMLNHDDGERADE